MLFPRRAPGPKHIHQHNPAVISEKDLMNDKCEPKTERRHGKCGQDDHSPLNYGYSPLQVFQLALIRARHRHCSRPTKLANSPPISAEVFRPNRRVRPVTANISCSVGPWEPLRDFSTILRGDTRGEMLARPKGQYHPQCPPPWR